MTVWIGRIGCATTILFATLGLIPTASVVAQNVPPPPPNLNVPTQPVTPPPATTPVQSAPLPIVPIQPIRQPDLPQFNRITPIQQPPSVERSFANPGRYRVVVDNDSPEVLQQVRFVQPDAFVQNLGGRRLIQVGRFNNEANARDQVTRLAYQGINARITSQSGSGIENGSSLRGYYVIIPGGREEVQRSYNRAIQLGISAAVLSVRDRPLGTHLAVGPFSEAREAEQVQQYLRDRGSLNGRLYYDR